MRTGGGGNSKTMLMAKQAKGGLEGRISQRQVSPGPGSRWPATQGQKTPGRFPWALPAASSKSRLRRPLSSLHLGSQALSVLVHDDTWWGHHFLHVAPGPQARILPPCSCIPSWKTGTPGATFVVRVHPRPGGLPQTGGKRRKVVTGGKGRRGRRERKEGRKRGGGKGREGRKGEGRL